MVSFSSRDNMQVFAILLLVVLAACKNRAQSNSPSKVWTEEQKRKYYTDSFSYSGNDFQMRRDTSVRFDKFMDEQYPELKAVNKYEPLIYAMEEPYIDTTKINKTKHWFRITVSPCSDYPIHWWWKRETSIHF